MCLYCYNSRAVNTSNRVRRITAGADRSAAILQRTEEDGKFPVDTLNNRLRARLVPYNRQPVPLGLRDPLVLGVLPGTLCSERKHGELRAVVPRSPLFGIGTN